ncbi:hypothetical protein lerEdw1_006336 [Lerista edwardsae]|nr:hypothetical protein lerEdw1_006336 [Lerista edwardsae]
MPSGRQPCSRLPSPRGRDGSPWALLLFRSVMLRAGPTLREAERGDGDSLGPPSDSSIASPTERRPAPGYAQDHASLPHRAHELPLDPGRRREAEAPAPGPPAPATTRLVRKAPSGCPVSGAPRAALSLKPLPSRSESAPGQHLLCSSTALGNEGAAAGSCRCRREDEEPPILRDFPERLQSCQTCPGHVFRFRFPRTAVCGHQTKAWALRFWHASCNQTRVRLPDDDGSRPAMGAEGSRPPLPRTPAPGSTVAPGPAQGTPEGTPRAQLAPDRTTGATWALGRVRSTPPAREGPGGAGPSRLSLQEAPGPSPAADGGSRVAVIALTGVALASAAVAVLVVCQRRRQGRGRPLAHHCPLPGDEVHYLPCTET